jgi:hypothetical protein
MDWFRQVNSYCERLDASYWAEPLNALSNLAFLAAAALVWPGVRGDRPARLLTGVLAVIGVGSWLFHTHAQVWALYADVIPIQAFILIYVYFATTRFFAAPWWAGAASVAGFLLVAPLVAKAIAGAVGPLNGSVGYLPVPILIAGYALALRRRAPGILVASLVFRTLDAAICPVLPIGTHFLWHLLNAVMLGWMILTLAAAKLEAGRAGA